MNDNTIRFLALLPMIIVFGFIGIYFGYIYPTTQTQEVENTAKQIMALDKGGQSCSTLKDLYLDSYFERYNSGSKNTWHNAVREKLISNCIDKDHLQNLEFIETCMDGKTVGCQISKMKYPEAYENFNFRIAVLTNSTQWEMLGSK